MENSINKLSKIKQVEAPDFLYTRILQKIENSKLKDIPKPWAWTLASFSTVCLVFTLIVVVRNFSSQNENQALSESVDLVPNNTLYNE